MAAYAPLAGIPNATQGQEQLNQNALAEYTRAAQEKAQTAQIQQQTQGEAQRNQLQAQAIKDQDALTKTITQYDPTKNSLADVPKMITANGGSGQKALEAQQGLIAQKQNYLKMTDEQFAQEQRKSDLTQGVHDQVSQAAPEDKQNVYQQGLQSLSRAGVDVSKEPLQYPGDDVFAQHLPAIRLHSAILADANKDREVSAQEAKARLENAQAAHQEFVNGLTAKSKPGDFDSQVDAILPPKEAQTGGQNLYTKAMVNGALSRGDLPGAQKIMDDAFQSVNGVNKDIQVQTNPQIQQGKEAVAYAEGQGRASIENAQARGNDPAVASVPAKQVLPAKADYQKANADFAQNQAVTQRLNAMMDAAKSGNVIAYQIIPEEGTLQITTSQGVHRINMAEIEQYAGGGSLWQRMEGHFGKQLTGASIPASVLSDMAAIQKIQQEGSQSKYQNTIKGINKTYGSKFEPIPMSVGANGDESNALSVKAPNGKTYSFKDQASADAFKKAAGIQ